MFRLFQTTHDKKSQPGERQRRGAATVEFAVVIPVFGLFLAAMVEFGHAYMVQTTLRAAAKKAARIGSTDGTTTADVQQEATSIVSSAVNTQQLSVIVKNAGLFDTSADPSANFNINDLPDIELSDAETRQLYIVRLELPYDDVALFPPFWVDNLTLHSQSVMRHE